MGAMAIRLRAVSPRTENGRERALAARSAALTKSAVPAEPVAPAEPAASAVVASAVVVSVTSMSCP
ncbi:hypothetical protein GCM10010221_24900 [Streptomyces parvus]|nr:hypothetical protein GCM10010221_24900 [Streptomyces parvus]